MAEICAAGKISIGIAEVRSIEQVKSFEAKLELLVFSEPKIFEQRVVKIHETGAAHKVSTGSAWKAAARVVRGRAIKAGDIERIRIEITVEGPLTSRQDRIGHKIRPQAR